MKKIISLVLSFAAIALVMCSCANNVKPIDTQTTKETTTHTTPSGNTEKGDLMADYVAQAVTERIVDEKFIDAMLDFSARLLKGTTEKEKKNILISPLSIITALSMTANGSEKETRAQFEQVFGLTMDEMNEYLYSYVKNLMNGNGAKVKLANSIWFGEDGRLKVNADFLQTNKNYYDAQAYEKDFSDPKTVDEMNAWVSEHTDEMIKKIVDELSPECVMVLMNALVFDALWADQYEDYSCRTKTFTTYDGKKQDVKMMHSTESLYLEADGVCGFEKPYLLGYKFVALLPDENVDVFDYARSLTGEKLKAVLASKQYAQVRATTPAFEYDFDITLNGVLGAMGIEDAFSPSEANFSAMGECDNNVFIGKVIHKTHIELTQAGTKAAAVTAVMMEATSVGPGYEQYKTVTLDRPFVYMIIDNANELPLFMGVVTEIN
ncbi:MAG: serpin family protein [Clostridia bacterium]|nr:serpin family protein [Clostridia bacterium]